MWCGQVREGVYVLGPGWPSKGCEQNSGSPVPEALGTMAMKEIGKGNNCFCIGK